ARLDDLAAGGGTAALLRAWRLGGLGGKPEGLAFTPQGRAVVGPDTRQPRRKLFLPEPPGAPPRGRARAPGDPPIPRTRPRVPENAFSTALTQFGPRDPREKP